MKLKNILCGIDYMSWNVNSYENLFTFTGVTTAAYHIMQNLIETMTTHTGHRITRKYEWPFYLRCYVMVVYYASRSVVYFADDKYTLQYYAFECTDRDKSEIGVNLVKHD